MKGVKLWIVPAVVILLAIGIFPFAYGVYVSVLRTYIVPLGGEPFVGANNYIDLFLGGPGDLFWPVLLQTVGFASLTTLVGLVVALVLALLLAEEFKGRGIVRSILILPMSITPAVVGLMWKMDYDADWGIINYLLKALIPGSAPIPFLANRSTVIPALIIMDVWEWSPLMMLILLAGLQSLPVEPYEAARVDGASRWQVFANVTLPMLRGSILVAVLLRTIDALKTFDIIFISSRGGPGTASLLTSQWAYELAFVQSDIARMGYAAALSVIMFYVTIAFCNAYYRALQRVR